MTIAALNTLINTSAQNLSQFKGLSAAYGILLGGTPSIDGYTALINQNNTTNFGAGGTTVFNDENVYINTINALYQGNPAAKASFDAIVSGAATVQDALTLVYNFVIPAAARTEAGLNFFKSQATFFATRAAELGVAGTNGTALVAFASLTKIAVDNDIAGLGDTINDLRAAVANGTAAIPQGGTDFTPLETADGTGFDADDLAGGGNLNFNLTTAVDNLVGTASADTFNGSIGAAAPDPASTFNSGDKIDGGGGIDRLNVTITNAAATPIVQTTAIEEARFTNLSGGTSTLSAAAWNGLTSVGSVNSTNGLGLNNLQNNVTAVLSGVSLANNTDVLALGFADGKIGSSAGTFALDVTGVGSTVGAGVRNDVVVDVAGTDQFTTVSVKATGQNFIGLANAAGGGSSDIKLVTLNVTGDGFARIGAADGGNAVVYTNVKTVDASANKGGVRLDETIGNGAALTLTGGAGNDTFTVDTTAGGAANKTTVALGAGDDVLNLVAGVTNYTSIDSLKGGEGTADVIGFANAGDAKTIATAAADVRATISEFEIVRVAGAASQDFNIGKISGANYLQLETAGAVNGNTVSGFTSGATVEYRAEANSTGVVTIGMTNATNAGTPEDTLNIKFNAELTAAGVNTLNLATPGINILNVSTADRDASTVTFGTGTTAPVAGYGLNLSKAADVTTINVSGDRTLTITGAGNSALATVTATTATGNVTLDLSGFTGTQGVTYSGGTAIDTFTGTRFGDIVTGGTGNDVLTGRGGADKIDGGAGNDKITGDGIDPSQQTTSATFNLGALNYEANEKITVTLAGTTVTSAALAANDTPATAAAALAAAINGNGTLTGAGISALAAGGNVTVTTTGAAFTVALAGGGDGVSNEAANTTELDVFALPADGANAASYAISFNGTQVAISAAATNDDVGAALAAQLTTALGANQLGATTAVAYNAAANTLTITGPATGAAINFTATKDGVPFGLDGTAVPGVATNNNVVTFTNNAVGINGADILTGGDGNDTFIYTALAESTVTVTDTITDLNLGSNAIGGRVDAIQLLAATGFTGGAITVANAGSPIAGVGATLALALTAVTGAGGLLQNANSAGLLTFGTDTYLVVSDGNVANTNDLVIKVTGYVGSLDASDFFA